MHLNQLKKELLGSAPGAGLVDTGVSIELVSAPGRGKSSMVRQLISALTKRDGQQWGYAELFLATQTPPDLIGYQFKGTVVYDGVEFPITDPTAPTWFICEDGKPVFAYPRGILFLDEFGQGQTDVKAAAAELLLNRRLGKWRLPDGWIVIAASNRQSDRSGVTKSLDFVINRRLEIHVSDDLNSWKDWALTSGGLDPTFVAFAESNPQLVFTDGVPEKQGPWCTPRSLVMLANVFQTAMRDGKGDFRTDGYAMEIATGLVGQGVAAQIIATIKLSHEMPDFKEIVRDPKGVKVPEKPDAQMLVVYNLAHRVTAKDIDPVIEYLQRMPKDFGVIFARAALRRDPMLLHTDAFDKWVSNNASVLVAIS